MNCTHAASLTVSISASKSLSVLLGDYISLNCSTTSSAGGEDLGFLWLHCDSSSIAQEAEPLRTTSNILTLSHVTTEQLGGYLCAVITESGTDFGTAEVAITSASMCHAL